ncbi:response regulator [Arsenicibacter rosenii]|uniref:histidine kinase n=1 Tax=Arsenicibacter rosenii TaxID=1750698 RepID=A0A1S2VR49_9BACT|nr:response regulator [Arsenicibacter rosenii]OIN60870.1 histidine kinase [Arsenicibacter rosenii]
MRLASSNWLHLGSALIIGVGVILGTMFFRTINRQIDEAAWVREKHQTINQLLIIEKLLVDMETGQRAFRLTNQKRFLLPYNQALPQVEISLKKAADLTKDDTQQIDRFERVRLQIGHLIQFWSEQSEHNQSEVAGNPVQLTLQEKKQMDEVRLGLSQLLRVEQQALDDNEKQTAEWVDSMTFNSVLGTALLFLVAAVITYFYFLEFKKQKEIEDKLQHSVDELETFNQETRERNWYLTGVATLNDALQNLNELESVSKEALNVLVQYLKVPVAAFYCFDEDHQLLELNAAVALPASAPGAFRLGEGLVGQAAKSKQIQITDQVPGGFWTIRSASGQHVPKQVVCIPLWNGKELKGVIEFGTFDPLTPQAMTLLKGIAKDIAVAISAVQSRRKIMSLLEQVQLQKEVLENQQDELRQTNEELTRQTESLQASEEELRVQEEELRQINTELEERNAAMELTRQALAVKAKELEITGKYKSEFLANMSHELRTPLNSVLILAGLLSENKNKNLTDKQVEYAHVIQKSGSDLLKLINDILDLSKIEAGKIDFQFEDVATDSILRDLNQLFKVVADEKGVSLLMDVKKSVPATLHTDKQRLEQVIQNLLSNALKFTPKGGTVSLTFDVSDQLSGFTNESLSMASQVLRIAVTDTGIGIPPEKQQLIFEAFQQADGSTNRKFGGTGLGLSIVKELVRRLGGEVSLQSEAGKGSTFTIYLPQSAGEPTEPATVTEKPATFTIINPPKSIARGSEDGVEDDRNTVHEGDRLVLIIEDDPVFARIVRDVARARQYKALVALQGDEGMELARHYKPSAIILDMKLPVVDGWSILSWLKSDPRLKSIPVHVISGADEVRLSENGLQAYLQKPVTKQDLDNVFALLDTQLDGKPKKVLVWSSQEIVPGALSAFIRQRYGELVCDYTTTLANTLQQLDEKQYDCLLVDIRGNLRTGISELEQINLRVKATNLPVICYINEDLASTDERQLKRLTSAVIRESAQSAERLMDELELFLFKVREEKHEPLPQAGPLAGAGTLKGRKVLLVDDDMRNVFALSTLLDEQQMDVVTADNGREALDMLEEHADVDIVLMDIMMPEMDGYEATRRIRQDLGRGTLPIIALTAKAMPGDREKVIEAGASDYITKPVDSTRLFSLMRIWLSR